MMKSIPTFVQIPELLWDDPFFDMLLEEAEFASMTREEQKDYRNSLKMKNDYYNTIEYARMEGMEKGKEDTAKNLKNLGVDTVIIAKSTGLSEEQIAIL